MERKRLRPKRAVDYQVARSNDVWPDHRARTLVTGGLVAWVKPQVVLDPACGDGSIVLAAHRQHPIDIAVLSDISVPSISSLQTKGLPSGWEAFTSTIEQAIIHRDHEWDVVVLTEILEHLEQPEAVLDMARRRSRYLVASSPVMRTGQTDRNPEHLWMFDAEGYREMLRSSGWSDVHHTVMTFASEYDFQVWVCE